ncbi:MAG: hypothetical protein J0H30_01780, partial [Alphaproteobacteria bacterium]|nr:hypothetical protein [Alphaproteobacteria bacterium]
AGEIGDGVSPSDKKCNISQILSKLNMGLSGRGISAFAFLCGMIVSQIQWLTVLLQRNGYPGLAVMNDFR